jgi:hypothetical protein
MKRYKTLREELGVRVADQRTGSVVRTADGRWRAKRGARGDDGGYSVEYFDSREEGEGWVKGAGDGIRQTGVSWTHVSKDEAERRKAQRGRDYTARQERERQERERRGPMSAALRDRAAARAGAEWERQKAAQQRGEK